MREGRWLSQLRVKKGGEEEEHVDVLFAIVVTEDVSHAEISWLNELAIRNTAVWKCRSNADNQHISTHGHVTTST